MKLYRFRYSPFARKVQTVLDLLGLRYTLTEVAYGERTELAELTGGYVYVPVLQDDDGRALFDSRVICRALLERPGAEWLAPSPLEGPVWGYADFCDGPLEDLTFRIASPEVRESWSSPSDRALYVMVKERKFGAGCIDRWHAERAGMITRVRELLAPSFVTLRKRPFLFGERPTLADAALHGSSLMLQEARAELLTEIAPELSEHARRMEEVLAGTRR